jgi:hypothetical protein
MQNHWIALNLKKERQSKYKIRLLHHNGVCWEVVWEGPFVEDFVFTASQWGGTLVSGVCIVDENGKAVWEDIHIGTFNLSPNDEMRMNFSSMGL